MWETKTHRPVLFVALICTGGIALGLVLGEMTTGPRNVRLLSDKATDGFGAAVERNEDIYHAGGITENEGTRHNRTAEAREEEHRLLAELSIIRGVVLDKGGSPIVNAEVKNVDYNHVDITEKALTDKGGAFRLKVTARSEGEILRTTAKGFVPGFTRSFPGRVHTIHLARGVSISGRLLLASPDGEPTPIPGQDVLFGMCTWCPSVSRTDPEGRFEFCARRFSMERISVRLESQAEWREEIAVDDVPLVHDIVIPWQEAVIKVHVTDHGSGNPIADAEIRSRGLFAGRTTEDGYLDLRVKRGIACEIAASAPGYTTRSGRIEFPPAGTTPLYLGLVVAGELFGSVTDQSGNPIEGAEVRLQIRALRLTIPTFHGATGLNTGAVTYTDNAGAFRFAGIGNRDNRLDAAVEVTHADYARTESENVTVRTGATVGPILVVLPRAASIAGIVRTNGAGAKAMVTIEESPRMETRSDDLGRYRLEGVPPGDWTLRVYLEESPQIIERVGISIREGDRLQRDMDLSYFLAKIQGVVESSGGYPVRDVPIVCESSTIWKHKPKVYASRSNDEGWYEFEVPCRPGLRSTEYTLRLTRWLDDHSESAILPPATVAIQTTPSTTVSLRPISAATGRPLRWFVLGWYPGEFEVDQLTVSFCLDRVERSDGMIEVVVPAGDGWVELEGPNCLPVSMALSGPSSSLGIIEMDTL